jgi:prepilin peptidase CpaA
MWMTLEHPYAVIQWGAVLGASLVAASTDLRRRRIPNWLTGPLLLSGLVFAFAVGGAGGLLDGLAACVVLALPFVLLFVFAGGGAGDAKLMGAVGAWLGLAQGLVALASVSLCGVALAALFAQRRRNLGAVAVRIAALGRGALAPLFGAGSLRAVPDLLPSPSEGQKMPYGLAILAGLAVAACIVLPGGGA